MNNVSQKQSLTINNIFIALADMSELDKNNCHWDSKKHIFRHFVLLFFCIFSRQEVRFPLCGQIWWSSIELFHVWFIRLHLMHRMVTQCAIERVRRDHSRTDIVYHHKQWKSTNRDVTAIFPPMLSSLGLNYGLLLLASMDEHFMPLHVLDNNRLRHYNGVATGVQMKL